MADLRLIRVVRRSMNLSVRTVLVSTRIATATSLQML